MASLLIVLLALLTLIASFAATPIPLCDWDRTGNPTIGVWGYCRPSSEYVAAQTASLPMGRYEVLKAKASIACSKHKLTGPRPNFAACATDKVNGCYVEGTLAAPGVPPVPWSCSSFDYVHLHRLGYLCKGALYTERVRCQAKHRDECTGDCSWRPDLTWYNMTEWREYQTKSNGTFRNYAYCWPTKYLSKFKTPDEFKNWLDSMSPDPSNYKLYVKMRGTCKYAIDSAKRIAYFNRCRSFNGKNNGMMLGKLLPNGTAFSSPGANTTALIECVKAGCTLDYLPTGYANGSNDQDYVECYTEPSIRYALGILGSQDTGLARAIGACTAPAIRFNKALCLAATYVPPK